MSEFASHCRYCTQSFIYVEQSDVKHLCVGCKTLIDAEGDFGVPHYYYCKSCYRFCLYHSQSNGVIAEYSYSSYPFCYGCDSDWDDE